MLLPPITIEQDLGCPVTIQPRTTSLTIAQELGCPITIQGGSIVSNTIPFQATAISDNQTVFTIPYTFSTIVCLFIMGIGQNILGGDYTVNGNQITLSQGIPSGYVIFGAGQI